jgi:hypothetical protein
LFAAFFVTAQVLPPRARGQVEVGAVPRRKSRAEGPYFLKKSSKKLLVILASACPGRLAQVSQKFFGSFFQKRTAFWHVGLLGVFTFRLPGQLPFFQKTRPSLR